MKTVINKKAVFILIFILILIGGVTALVLFTDAEQILLNNLNRSQQNETIAKDIIGPVPDDSKTIAPELNGEWTVIMTGNESKMYTYVLEKGRIRIIPLAEHNITYEECFGPDEKEICTNVTYFYPNTLKLRKNESASLGQAQDVSKTGNDFIISLNISESTYYKIGTDSITIIGDTAYSSLDTNVTQEVGYTHSNISLEEPYNNLRLYLPFDIGTDPEYDYSRLENDGSLTVPPIYNDSGGIYGGAYEFNGSGQRIRVGNGSDFNDVCNNGCSFGAWFKKRDTTKHGRFLGRFDGTGDNKFFLLWVNDDEGFTGSVSSNGSTSGSCSATTGFGKVTIDQWHHGFVSFNGSQVSLYFDGTNIANTSCGFDQVNALNWQDYEPTDIGNVDFSYYWNGTVDEAMIFNMTLNHSHISDIYNNQSKRFVLSGDQVFNDTNISTVGTENRANISLTNYLNNLSTNISVQVGDSAFVNLSSTGTATDIEYTLDPNAINITFRYFSGGTQFFTPYLIGNITIDSWTEAVGDTDPPYFTFIPDNETINFTGSWAGVDFNATDAVGFDAYAVNSTYFTINSTGHLINASTLGVDSYLINITINDTTNNLNSTIYNFTVNQIQQAPTIELNGATANLTVTYPQQVNVSVASNQSAATIDVNGTSFTAGANNTLGASTWFVNVTFADEQNYSLNETYWEITVNQANNPFDIFLNGADANLSVIFPQHVNVTTTTNNTAASIDVNGTAFTNGQNFTTLGGGNWFVNISVASNQNYTANETYRQIDVNTTVSNVTTYIDGARSNKTITANFTAVINGSVITGETDLTIYQDNVEINSGTATTNTTNFTSIGEYNFTSIILATQNYSSSFETYWLNVTPEPVGAQPTIDIERVYPANVDLNVTQNRWFNITINVTCRSADCGIVNISLDPTIQLQTANTENLDDARVRSTLPDNNDGSSTILAAVNTSIGHAATWIKFNISQIPVGATITDAQLVVKDDEANLMDDGETNILTAFNSHNISWTEENITWNNQPTWNETPLASQPYINGTSHTWFNFTVTSAVTTHHLASNSNISFIIRGTNRTGNPDPANEFPGFRSKEWVNTSQRPYLNITFITSSNKGLISNTTGATPFYTNGSNPIPINLSQDESYEMVWWVNATGTVGVNYTFFAYVNQTADLSINNITSLWNVTINQSGAEPAADLEYPTFYNFTDNNGTLVGSGNVSISLNINQTNGTAGISFNLTNYTLFNETANFFNVSFNISNEGDFEYFAWSYGNGTDANYNQSATRIYTINSSADTTQPYFTFIPNNETIDYLGSWSGVDFNATDDVAFDSYAVNSSYFTINSTGHLINASVLGVDSYFVNVTINDTSNNLNSTIYLFTVNQINQNVPVELNGVTANLTVTFPQQTNVSVSGNQTATSIDINGSSISAGQNFSLGGGGWFVNVTTPDSQNYSVNETYWLITVSPTTSLVYTYIDGSRSNATITANFTAITNGSVITGETDLTLYQDNVAINEGTAVTNTTNFTSIGEFNFTSIIPATQNYTTSFETFWLNVTPEPADTAPPYFTVIPDNATIAYLGSWDGVDFNATDAIGFDSYAVNSSYFTINSTGHLINASVLGVDTYFVNVTINDTTNNLNSTIYQFDVTQITDAVTVELNGASANLTVDYPQQVNVSISGNESAATIDVNGTSFTAGSNNTQGFGVWFVNVSTAGDQNYSLNETYWEIIVNKGFGNVTLYLNNTQANVTISDGATVVLTANLTRGDFGSIVLYNNGTIINNATSNVTNTTTFTEGNYNISAHYEGNQNYTSNWSYNWWVDVLAPADITPPNISMVSPANATNTTDSGIDVNYTVSSDAQACFYTNNSGESNQTITCGVNLTTSVWLEGINNVTIYANDSSGNENSTSVTFTVDTTAPTFDNLINHSQVANISFTWDLNATDVSLDVQGFTLNDTSVFSINQSTGFIENSTALETVETYYLNTTVNDTLGNANSKVFFINITAPAVSLEPDTLFFDYYMSDFSNQFPQRVCWRLRTGYACLNGSGFNFIAL